MIAPKDWMRATGREAEGRPGPSTPAVPARTCSQPKGWMRATSCIECVDVWTPGQLTPLKRAAYDRLARIGEIKPVSISRDPAGRIIVRYLAAAPQQWERQAMGEICREGVQTAMEDML